ncbi:response regulator transcription factor [Micromonospora sp. NPDC050417]|uniref:response regulator transcription factor n=1 Tax=Micromonospora sp. NPDC050417 TaxID=3364280 RepID=UPI00379F7C73
MNIADDSPYAGTSEDAAPLRLAVVSGNPIIRSGLAHVLADAPGVTVRYDVDSVTALPLHDDPPALVVLDLYGHRSARLGASFWALLPRGSRAIALCRPEDPPNLPVAIQGGTHAFLTRESDTKELLLAVETTRQGGLHVCAVLLGHLVKQTAPEPTGRLPQLASREIETLQWVAKGLTHGQISRRMGLTESTVSTYVKRIRTKLNAGNKAELTRRAIELGYVTAG